MSAAPAQPATEEQRKATTKFRWLAFAVFLLALVVRLAYFFGAQVDHPIRGDIVQYVNYAWNLLNHGTFSLADPGSAQVSPDAFRGPGYPAFLAVWIWLVGPGGNWYFVAVMAQLLIGALLAPLSIAWTRLWLPRGAALSVGFLVTLWPHAGAACVARHAPLVENLTRTALRACRGQGEMRTGAFFPSILPGAAGIFMAGRTPFRN